MALVLDWLLLMGLGILQSLIHRSHRVHSLIHELALRRQPNKWAEKRRIWMRMRRRMLTLRRLRKRSIVYGATERMQWMIRNNMEEQTSCARRLSINWTRKRYERQKTTESDWMKMQEGEKNFKLLNESDPFSFMFYSWISDLVGMHTKSGNGGSDFLKVFAFLSPIGDWPSGNQT